MRWYLLRKNLPKTDRTLNLLKYSPEELKLHIESRFDDTMTWGNYGKIWQIDHIIPVSLFRDDAPIDVVNSLENLRPLDKIVNITRKNKLDSLGITIIHKFKTYLKENSIN